MPSSPSDIANSLELWGLHKAYGLTVAVRRVDLEIGTPVYCCLLGPSGCSKTSLLRMIAGHEVINAGNASDLPDPFTDFLPDDNAKRSNSKQYRQGMNARAASGFRQAC